MFRVGIPLMIFVSSDLRVKILFFLLVACIGVLPGTAHAARFSGGYLLKLCDLDDEGREKLAGGAPACQAYIAGVIDYHSVLQSMNIAPKVDICIPDDVTSEELHGVVLDYLRKNPQHDSFIAAPAVTMALFEVFPCR